MGIKDIAVYNEPAREPSGDVVPRLPRVAVEVLEPVVRVRLELERELRQCAHGGAQQVEFAPEAHEVVLKMLAEADSPLSASLRARAAVLAGPLRLKRAVPLLRKMALDEKEDLLARVNATRSIVTLGVSAADFSALMKAKAWQVRAVALAVGMRSSSPATVALATAARATQRHKKVIAFVDRRPGGAQRSRPRAGGDPTASDE